MSQHKIVFTGGGSAGHVVPNIPLIQKFQAAGFEVFYIGSYDGIERDIIKPYNLSFYPIMNGRLRRYMTIKNFFAPFAVLIGFIQALIILLKCRPQAVFSKGGYVSFPVILAAWLLQIPAFSHESDLTPGLANRLSFPFVKKLFITFEEGKKFYRNQDKIRVTGTPIRSELLTGDKMRAKKTLGFDEKPVLLIMGGGLGAVLINETVVAALPALTPFFNIIHLTGAGKQLSVDEKYQQNYRAFERLYGETMADYFAYAEYVISRAGANTLYELVKLQKPHLLIPLSRQVSRGDQVDNAAYFQRLGFSEVLAESDLNTENLIEKLQYLVAHRSVYQSAMSAHPLPDAVESIYENIVSVFL
jgi:UDP-N-acetylglucosamine--N-acetylmuramyl-(pentapeptide) pyrophosphoryl-undecaprenol N-acetylglucosamine transferase